MNTDEVRRGLRDVRTRADMIRVAAGQGDAAVDLVLPLLQDRNEGVRWSAIRILAEAGDTRAVGPLIRLLDQGRNAAAAADALRAITGQPLDDSPAAWRRWAVQEPGVRNIAGGEILSDEELLREATRDLPAEVSGEDRQYSVQVSLPENRAQRVWIDFSSTDPEGRPIVQLSTPCGDADPDQYETALKLNMSIPYGAIALAALDGRLCLAMVDAYLRESVHPEQIARSIFSLAQQGDSVERSLSQEDRF